MHEDVRSVYFKDVSEPLFSLFQRVKVVEHEDDWHFEGEGFICGLKLYDAQHLAKGWWYEILFTSMSCWCPQLPHRDWEHEDDIKLFPGSDEGVSHE